METLQIMVIILGSILAFILFWIAIIWLIAQLSGWSKLADVYPAHTPFNETCWSMQSGRFRGYSNYSGILHVCADSRALHLSTFILFRPGNPPLSIPWEDITSKSQTFGIELRFFRADGVPLLISRQLAERLEQASAGKFRLETG
ncbi:MAG: hypothetical protein KBA85_02505 [Chloroflexi bacterium]|nr:hypothetical protein [Chloroflexota bacterium]MBP7590448.1 hypothetical protein [Chloroflexota bacterium]